MLGDSVGKCCMVLELYSTSDYHYKQMLSENNNGMVLCIFVDEIPFQE
jgi:hypothetical protein